MHQFCATSRPGGIPDAAVYYYSSYVYILCLLSHELMCVTLLQTVFSALRIFAVRGEKYLVPCIILLFNLIAAVGNVVRSICLSTYEVSMSVLVFSGQDSLYVCLPSNDDSTLCDSSNLAQCRRLLVSPLISQNVVS